MKPLQSSKVGMPESPIVYVAEIGESGAIQWVWVHRPGSKGSRPFDPVRDRVDAVGPVKFSGASPDAIKVWLSTHVS